MQQTMFASVAWEKKGKITRRERFLAEMDAVIPWARLLALIEPPYPMAGNGTQPKPMEQMLRSYSMQNRFNLLDPQAEDSLFDIESMRRFAGIELPRTRHSGQVDLRLQQGALPRTGEEYRTVVHAFALVNLYLLRRRLLPAQWTDAL
jgi:hypothetical protein